MNCFLVIIIFILTIFPNTSYSQSKKPFKQKNFIPWSNLKENGKDLCPLCGEIYIPKDFKKLPSKLSLSAWHDNNLDSAHFENKISNISDMDLIESIDWNKFKIKSEKSKQRIELSIKQFLDFKYQVKDNNRFYGYNQFDESIFVTDDEYRSLIIKDTSKLNTLLHYANDVLENNIPYGNRHFKFNEKIDFNFNFGESAKYGFHYWGWGNYLISSFIYSKRKDYVSCFDKNFNDWYDQRNMISNTLEHYDVVWYELGIAARLPVFIDAFRVFKDDSMLKNSTRERMLKIFLGSGRWLSASLKSNPYHPYNWPIHSALSLCYLALTFPEFKESLEWLKIAKKVMEDHLAQDLYEDGGYIERTPSYSFGVFYHFFRYLSLFKYFSNEVNYYNKYSPVAAKMAEFQIYTMSPLGTCCPFNDSYRSRIVDFAIEYGKKFERNDFIGSIHDLLNPSELKQIKPKPVKPRFTSINFIDSKFAVMRSGWSKNALMMIINYGPAANHNHEDILDFEIYAYGKSIAIDAGIGPKGYDDEFHLNWYRTGKSHNMIIINDTSVFRGEAVGENVKWASLKNIDYFGASHKGYESKFGVINRRQIVFVKPYYWLIFDSVSSKHPGNKLEWLFHSPLELEENQYGYVSKTSPGALIIYPENEGNNPRKIKNEGMANLVGFIDEVDKFRKINYISFQKTVSENKDEDNFSILVFPFLEQKPDVQFKKLQTPGGANGYEISYGNSKDILIISDGLRKEFVGGVVTDASLLFIRYEGNKMKKISIVTGSFCKIGKKVILNNKEFINYETNF